MIAMNLIMIKEVIFEWVRADIDAMLALIEPFHLSFWPPSDEESDRFSQIMCSLVTLDPEPIRPGLKTDLYGLS